MAAQEAAKAETTAALDRINYWNNTWGTTAPTMAAPLGMVLAAVLPLTFYTILPAPSGGEGACGPDGRLAVLLNLQIFPALVGLFYIVFTGSQRITTPAAAHDPAAAYKAQIMPMTVIAANRAFTNTLEQYMLLLATSAALLNKLPCDQLMILPALYLTWSVCRILYVVGYVKNGSARMIGFPGTVMPTMAALGYAVYLAATEHAFY